MIQQLISRKIGALIDWAACFMGQVYPKHEQDHQTIALFKNILMTIDYAWFKQLLSQPYSIRQLEIKVNQYFKEKYQQVKETVLQGGTKQNSDIRILAMFQLLLELAYVSTKQQCLTAISELDDYPKEQINKILQQIIKQRGHRGSTARQISSQDFTIKRLKQENKRLKGALQALKINQQSLIQQNLQLEKRIRQLEYQYLKKQSEVEESTRKICQLQNILKQISVQVFNEDISQNSISKQNSYSQDANPMINIKLVNSIEYQKQNPKFPTILQNIDEEQSKQVATNNANKSFEQDQKANDGWYMKKLERQYRKSQQINHRFHLLKQMHLKLQREVENILIS